MWDPFVEDPTDLFDVVRATVNGVIIKYNLKECQKADLDPWESGFEVKIILHDVAQNQLSQYLSMNGVDAGSLPAKHQKTQVFPKHWCLKKVLLSCRKMAEGHSTVMLQPYRQLVRIRPGDTMEVLPCM